MKSGLLQPIFSVKAKYHGCCPLANLNNKKSFSSLHVANSHKGLSIYDVMQVGEGNSHFCAAMCEGLNKNGNLV